MVAADLKLLPSVGAQQRPRGRDPTHLVEPQFWGTFGLHGSEHKTPSWLQASGAGVGGRWMLLMWAGPLRGQTSPSRCHVGLQGGMAEVRDLRLVQGLRCTHQGFSAVGGSTLGPVSESRPRVCPEQTLASFGGGRGACWPESRR